MVVVAFVVDAALVVDSGGADDVVAWFSDVTGVVPVASAVGAGTASEPPSLAHAETRKSTATAPIRGRRGTRCILGR